MSNRPLTTSIFHTSTAIFNPRVATYMDNENEARIIKEGKSVKDELDTQALYKSVHIKPNVDETVMDSNSTLDIPKDELAGLVAFHSKEVDNKSASTSGDAAACRAPNNISQLPVLSALLYEQYSDTVRYLRTSLVAVPLGSQRLATLCQIMADIHHNFFVLQQQMADLDLSIIYRKATAAATFPDDPSYPERIGNLALGFLHRYRLTGALVDLEPAIKFGNKALDSSVEQHPLWLKHLSFVADAYILRYSKLGLDGDLEKNLSCLKRMPADASCQKALAWAYHERFQKFGKMDDIDKSVFYYKAALASTPEDDPSYTNYLSIIGEAYALMFNKLDNLEALENALKYQKRLVEKTPEDGPTMPRYQSSLALSYESKYFRLGNVEDLQASLLYRKVALERTPADSPDLPERHYQLAISFGNRYRELGALEDIQIALMHYKAAVASTTEDHILYAPRQFSLAVAYIDLYDRFGDIEYFNAGLECKKIALEKTPPGEPSLANRQTSLAASYAERYGLLKDPNDLQQSIILGNAALDNTPPDHPDIALRQANLATSYKNSFWRFEVSEDLETALKLYKLAVEKTPSGHKDAAKRQVDLASAYSARYWRLGHINDLEISLTYRKAALENVAVDNPILASLQGGLAEAYGDRYQHLYLEEDFDTARKYFKLALSDASMDHQNSRLQSLLASLHRNQYKKLGAIKALQKAIKYGEMAVNGTPKDHSILPRRQHALATAYIIRYDRLDSIDDVEKALTLDISALNKTPNHKPEYAELQASVASAYGHRYNRTGDPADLEAKIRYTRASIASTPSNHHQLLSRRIDLARGLESRYIALQNLADLEECFEIQKSALDELGAASDSPMFSNLQSSIALSYGIRYSRFRELADLEAALQFAEVGLDTTPKGHPNLRERQAEIATLHFSRYFALGHSTDLELTLKYRKLALENTPDDHTDLRFSQSALATGYKTCYDQHGNLEDLAEALKFYTLALKNTPEGHQDLPYEYGCLATCYMCRFIRLQNVDDLETCLSMNRMAVQKTPDGHLALQERLSQLAISYETRYRLHNDPADKAAYLHLAEKAIGTFPVAPIETTWSVVVSMAKLAMKYDSQLALKAYKEAFNTISELLWIGSPLSTRHHELVRHDVQGTVASATASAIELKHLELAVEFLEQGLSITHQQILKLRDESTGLAHDHPDDATRLKELSLKLLQINNPELPGDDTNRHNLASARNMLLEKIRGYDGYNSFHLPASYERLSQAASAGPVIILTGTSSGANALVILKPSSPPILVKLPAVDLQKLGEYSEILESALGDFRIHFRDASAEPTRYGKLSRSSVDEFGDKFRQVLSWLWKSLVEPIFMTLAKYDINSGRIWWCTSGPFKYLPVHAAAPTDNLYIQSYTSTLGDLIKARERESPANQGPFTTVGIISVHERPGLGLPLVGEEIKKVVSAAKNKPVEQLFDSDATMSNVMSAVQTSSWLHLACHGIQDTSNPLQSHLILSDGNLTLESILNTHLPYAQFAFLSACETARGDMKLVDEAMHFAGGFIAAGFRGAIGTLWSMSDADGPSVAEVVYNKMCEKGEGPDLVLAAEGLHLAVQKLRRQGVPPHRWIPFVHFGV